MSAEFDNELDRRDIFLETVRMQDEGSSVADSRTRIAEEFDVDVDTVREIESEGIAKKLAAVMNESKRAAPNLVAA